VHHSHEHGHDHGHERHAEEEASARTIRIEMDILAKNNRLASGNRALFAGKGLFVLNLVSSPGSGKTTLMERTLDDLAARHRFAVIEGDQQWDGRMVRLAVGRFGEGPRKPGVNPEESS
jgi:hydrogenase nickel incorporation protein HypB